MPDFQAYCGEGEPRFANDVELECAKLLDYYRVPWDYEPRRSCSNAPRTERLEAFKPDFYLPEQDLYLELTVMKQSLVTRKNRKLRKLRRALPGRQRQALLQARHPAPGRAIQTRPRLIESDAPRRGGLSPAEEIARACRRARRRDRPRLRGPRAGARRLAEGERRLPRRPLAGDGDPARDRLHRARRLRGPDAGGPASGSSRISTLRSTAATCCSSRTSSTPA